MDKRQESSQEQIETTLVEIITAHRNALADIAFAERTRRMEPTATLRNIAEAFRDYLSRSLDSEFIHVDIDQFILAFRQLYPIRNNKEAFLIFALGETESDL